MKDFNRRDLITLSFTSAAMLVAAMAFADDKDKRKHENKNTHVDRQDKPNHQSRPNHGEIIREHSPRPDHEMISRRLHEETGIFITSECIFINNDWYVIYKCGTEDRPCSQEEFDRIEYILHHREYFPRHHGFLVHNAFRILLNYNNIVVVSIGTEDRPASDEDIVDAQKCFDNYFGSEVTCVVVSEVVTYVTSPENYDSYNYFTFHLTSKSRPPSLHDQEHLSKLLQKRIGNKIKCIVSSPT